LIATSFTDRYTGIDWDPDALVAKTVYKVLDSNAVGVPERTPVVVEKLSPAVLSAGEREKLVGVPAVEVLGEKLAAIDLVATSVLDEG
jgi:hypothetical protein